MNTMTIGRTALATGIAAVAGIATLGLTTTAHAGQHQSSTLRLVEKGGGLRVVDNAPKAKHPYDFSPGDVVIVTRNIYGPAGKAEGTLRLVCTAITAAVQQCAGTETLPAGTLEVAGTSSPAPTTTVAVIGGTGDYAGARGTSASQDRKNSNDIADQTITLLP